MRSTLPSPSLSVRSAHSGRAPPGGTWTWTPWPRSTDAAVPAARIASAVPSAIVSRSLLVISLDLPARRHDETYCLARPCATEQPTRTTYPTCATKKASCRMHPHAHSEGPSGRRAPRASRLVTGNGRERRKRGHEEPVFGPGPGRPGRDRAAPARQPRSAPGTAHGASTRATARARRAPRRCASLNVPAATDVDRLGRRLRALSERLEAVEDTLDELARELAELGKASGQGRSAAASPAEPAAAAHRAPSRSRAPPSRRRPSAPPPPRGPRRRSACAPRRGRRR